MNGPIICPKDKKFDFTKVMKRASTWLGILTTMQAGVAAAFMASPQEWKQSFPDWIGLALLIGSMMTGALVPLATSYQQKNLKE